MIFVDSNVPMYLVGSAHPNRESLETFLRSRPDEDYVTSAEVYQEVVHRYVAIDRRAAISDAFALLDDLVVTVFPISRDDVGSAASIAASHAPLSARDCLHLAVMNAHRVSRILTFDHAFEHYPGVMRLPELDAV